MKDSRFYSLLQIVANIGLAIIFRHDLVCVAVLGLCAFGHFVVYLVNHHARRVPYHQLPPYGFGGAWIDHEKGELICIFMPFNLLVGAAMRVYWRCKGGIGEPQYKTELRTSNARRNYHIANLSAIHRDPDVPEEMKRVIRQNAKMNHIAPDDIMGSKTNESAT